MDRVTVRERAATLALLAGSLGLVLGLLEATARFTVGRPTRPESGARPLGRYHPLLGWEKTPGAEARLRRPEYDVHVAINAHGLRGPDRGYEKPEGAKRVLILGDSFGEGYYVEEPESVRALLEKDLQESVRGAQVLNGSTAGYSTDQEYLFYTSEGVRYRPDCVALFLFSNDLPDNLVATGNALRPKPVFVLKRGALVLENTPVPKTAASEDPGAPGLKPYHHSVALRWLSNRTDGSPGIHEFLARLLLVPHLARDPPRDFDAFRTDVKREPMWPLFEGILSSLNTAVRDGGGRLVVLYVPVRFEVEDAAWEAWVDRYPPRGRWERNRLVTRLGEACARLGIPLVDPRSALRGAGGPAYFPRDGHWNVLGNRVAAEALLPAVRGALGEAAGGS